MKTRETIKGILRGLADTSESAFYDDATWLSGANQGTSWWQSLVSTFNLIRHLTGRKTLGLLLIDRTGLLYSLLKLESFTFFQEWREWLWNPALCLVKHSKPRSFVLIIYLAHSFAIVRSFVVALLVFYSSLMTQHFSVPITNIYTIPAQTNFRFFSSFCPLFAFREVIKLHEGELWAYELLH